MPKKRLDSAALPTLVSERLAVWGRCIHTQRLRQRVKGADLCARMGISQATLRRLERGDPGAGVGIYLTAMLILGVLDRVSPVVYPVFWLDTGSSRVRDRQEATSTNVDYL